MLIPYQHLGVVPKVSFKKKLYFVHLSLGEGQFFLSFHVDGVKVTIPFITVFSCCCSLFYVLHISITYCPITCCIVPITPLVVVIYNYLIRKHMFSHWYWFSYPMSSWTQCFLVNNNCPSLYIYLFNVNFFPCTVVIIPPIVIY